MDPVGGDWAQAQIRYYVYAYLYVLFAVESVFLFPWAVVFDRPGFGVATVVEMGDFFFKPTVLRGRPGQRLTVTLSNQGNSLHDFSIPAQHIDANVEAGTPVTVTVTFPQKGALTFECRYHLLQNMRGELVTEGG